MTTARGVTEAAFSSHPRQWRESRYVYPVISRRSRGLSIGVNLNTGKNCNFDCVYCQVCRTEPARAEAVEFDVLAAELRRMLEHYEEVFEEQKYHDVPKEYRVIKDIAFSGDGEPTMSPAFPAAVGLAAELRGEFGLKDAKIVVLTNGAYLRKPAVLQTLAFLDDHNGELWAKLDAGTQKYFEQVSGVRAKLDDILENLLAASRARPIVIQSLFMRLHDEPTPESEVRAYVERLRKLLDQGGQIKLVQAYTTARKTAQPFVGKLSEEELEKIAEAIRPLGVAVETFV